MMALGQYNRGRKVRILGESETLSSNGCSKRRGSHRVTTNVMENINVLFP
jgi:hypothetical protein